MRRLEHITMWKNLILALTGSYDYNCNFSSQSKSEDNIEKCRTRKLGGLNSCTKAFQIVDRTIISFSYEGENCIGK